ncbi:hypothetical protein [Acinetobacter oleivorans]|uniref:Uncharacterized protein n=1 Tax=Acinetobacter oleivorans (strain JCM 16667 / KCTC 23045 / DR1) TaxID=436717 RepID=A0AAN0PAJ6_ACISD|nr:hypothetical protein [Acinetobacter oleivorans]ADI91910.1 hypothetical protein AOLE_15115 [Acinetobacter oleivorans DR1]ESK44741.1 hypothetical protein P254_02265 [Acinetobacter oleivorans CIP 110421]
MQKVKHHPDGYKSYLGRDNTGLYSVRIGWQVYASNANGTVLYKIIKEVKTPLDVEKFKTEYPKVWEVLTQVISFERTKQLAKDLGDSHIPSTDRKNYKRTRGFTGSR